MKTTRADVLGWIEGFQAARAAEREAGRRDDRPSSIAVALQVSEAALAARAPEMKARREAEDERARDTWCRLKSRRPQ